MSGRSSTYSRRGITPGHLSASGASMVTRSGTRLRPRDFDIKGSRPTGCVGRGLLRRGEKGGSRGGSWRR